MSGHNKWAKIKHKKGANDARRGAIFAKVIRELSVAARHGTDPETNPSLRKAMDRAKTVNMSSETIERAIKRGAGGEDGAHYEEIYYEGYAPGGVAVLVRALTENRNRTSGDLKYVFSKHNGALAEKGAVEFNFARMGLIAGDLTGPWTEDKLFETALDCGAQDVTFDSGSYEILTEPTEFGAVRNALTAKGVPIQTSEITYIPRNTVALNEDAAEKVLRLISALEDQEDIQDVYSNLEASAEVMEHVLEKA